VLELLEPGARAWTVQALVQLEPLAVVLDLRAHLRHAIGAPVKG
jgi:hypothetical protein